ncbi:MAG: LytTR family DNA-binding domain-containing protein [Myxococcota bacterium]
MFALSALVTLALRGDTALTWVEAESVVVCPATDVVGGPPKETADCERGTLPEIGLAHRTVWLITTLDLDLTERGVGVRDPTGLYVSLKGASRGFVNGTWVGQSGVPGLDASAETPGKLDAVFFVPDGLLRPGPNTVAVLVSGHHAPIVRSQDVHHIAFARYGRVEAITLASYVVPLLTFGVFLLGTLYFGASARYSPRNRTAAALAIASLFTGCQLLAEALRGLWGYPYPVQGFRLGLIAVCAAGVGCALVVYVAERFSTPHRRWIVAAVLVLSALLLAFAPDFNSKSVSVVSLTGLVASAVAVTARGQPGAYRFAAAFLGLTVLNLIDPTEYFDVYAFVALASLFLFLFTEEARSLHESQRKHGEVQGRLLQLEADLARSERTPAVSLTVHSVGRTERISSREVAAASAAGDYVELHLTSGRTLLHHCSLAALEEQLPELLRVHRSHLVNTEHVVELIRKSSGVGELRLSNGTVLPVSRRIMPKVRRALDGA